VVVEEKVEERMKVFNFQQNKAAAELEDADVLVVQERVKCADTDANALANALEDASVLLALATADALNLAAPRNVDLAVTDADVRGSHSCIYFIISSILGYYKN
jgi:hypothetical protein